MQYDRIREGVRIFVRKLSHVPSISNIKKTNGYGLFYVFQAYGKTIIRF
jgi:hypothetical protein